MKFLVTGGTGLVGRRLCRVLRDDQHDVTVLTRGQAGEIKDLPDGTNVISGDPTQPGDWMDTAAQCDVVVHLAGENIFAKRWSDAFKQRICDSRVTSTENVASAVNRPDAATSVFVCASAIGIYGDRGEEELTEASSLGSGFLEDVCKRWEAAAAVVSGSVVSGSGGSASGNRPGLRCVQIRIGVVMDPDGGALKQMVLPFKMFAGGPVGNGKQWMSWIHVDDLARLILFAATNDQINGPLNATAPNPERNRDFAKALGRVLGRPSFMPTPGVALRVMLGEVADVVLASTKVIPRKALDAGFEFEYPNIFDALSHLLRR